MKKCSQLTGFKVSSNPGDLDIELIYSVVASTYWAKGISFSIFKKSLENSLVFGAYDEHNKQVGFARVVTDKSTFAYLCDVFVLENFRGCVF